LAPLREDGGKQGRRNLLITLSKLQKAFLFEAKFLFGVNVWGKIFSETLFIQNFGFDGEAHRFCGFLPVFLRVLAGCFIPYKIFYGCIYTE